jgi:hypothetical protein
VFQLKKPDLRRPSDRLHFKRLVVKILCLVPGSEGGSRPKGAVRRAGDIGRACRFLDLW